MSAYVDAHCHLDLLPDIHTNPFQENTGNIKSLTVTNAPYLFEPNQRLFADCEHIRVGLGFHPEVLGDPRLLSQLNPQLELFDAQFSGARYIGEVGLDGSSVWKEAWPVQMTVLKHIVKQCEREGNKILTVHSRQAVVEVLTLLASKRMIAQNNRVILHWFSGSARELELAIAAGVYFSVNHQMLRSAKGKQLVSMMPPNRVLTETDAPFTFDATITTREQSLVNTVSQLALIWHMTHEETRSLLWSSFKQLLTNN
ncbi:Qat anti-phage system TatD family nuclease QatD [Hymenobacter sp. B1770]|uniref:Qat anti-phage system TatD family nuclease QatD n=1 Tax=Hymenobacter sp. B1770 TaxID=1718788 RepID=UPI003CF4ECBD